MLVVGGGGFIGRNLAERLVRDGHRCIVIDNDSGLSAIRDLPRSVRLIESDARDSASLNLPKIDTIYYLAGRVGGIAYNDTHQEAMYSLNRDASSGLEACYQLKPHRVVYFSTACVYPKSAPVPTPVESGYAGEPERRNAGYGTAKREGEALAQSLHRKTKIQTLVVRPFNAYGPWDFFDPAWGHFIPALIWKMLSREPRIEVWGGRQTRSFVYVEDIVDAVIRASEVCEDFQTVNIGHAKEVTIQDATVLLKVATRYSGEIKFVDGPIGYSRRASSDIELRRMIGPTRWTSLKNGIGRTVEWCQKTGLHRLSMVRNAKSAAAA